MITVYKEKSINVTAMQLSSKMQIWDAFYKLGMKNVLYKESNNIMKSYCLINDKLMSQMNNTPQDMNKLM